MVTGRFSSSYVVREKRSVFFQNAWRSAAGYKLLQSSSRIETHEFQNAKEAGLIISEFAEYFPIMDINNYDLEEEE